MLLHYFSFTTRISISLSVLTATSHRLCLITIDRNEEEEKEVKINGKIYKKIETEMMNVVEEAP